MLTNSSYMSEVVDTLTRNKNKSTDIYLERYNQPNGIFNRDILDEEDGETKQPFKLEPGEKILSRLNGIVWVENLSIGDLVLTSTRLFYHPIYYDIPMTTKNLEIGLQGISKIGNWTTKSASGIILIAGTSGAKVEFVSKIPFKMIKMYHQLKTMNKNWNYLSLGEINKLQKSGSSNGLALATGAVAGGVVLGGAILGGVKLISKFLSGEKKNDK